MWLVTTAVAALPTPAQTQAGASVTAFAHVAVIPMDSERVLPNQMVLVQGDRIVALGPAARIQVPAGAIRIEGKGKFLIPGLADMHVHICALPCTPNAPPESMYPDLLPYLANGVTTVRDMHSGGADSPLFAVRRTVASGQVLGPRIYTAGDPLYDDASAAATSTAALKAAGHDFVKLYGWKGAVYDSVVATAHRVHLRIVGHAPPDRKLEDILSDRWASLEHLMGYLEYVMGRSGRWDQTGLFLMDHQSLVDTAAWMQTTYPFPDKELRAVAAATRQAGVWNCPTLLNYGGSLALLSGDDDPKAAFRVIERVYEFQGRITKALQDVGAGLLLGTDAILSGSLTAGPILGFSIHAALQLLVQAGLTPYQALATGTRNVADFLGTADSTGTVAVGKRADLVLLNGNPLQDIRATMRPAGVMVGGHWLPQAVFDDARAQILSRFPPDQYPKSVLKQFYPELLEALPP